MEHDTAGDPITGLKWTRKTTQKLSDELTHHGILVSAKTVGRLLKDMRFSLRVNSKTIESGIKNPPAPKDRDRQFRYISQLRDSFAKAGNPVISVDSKKRELVGNFKNGGKSWQREALAVKDHDFPSDAEGVAVLYGIYCTQMNRGNLYVGTSHDTPAFAVRCIAQWWKQTGIKSRPNATSLLILADCGGSNSPARGFGNTASKMNYAMHTISLLPFVTIHRVRPSGIPSNTACLRKFQRTGQANLWYPTKKS